MGSIRSPAVFCGITGHKPTYGLVGRSGVFPLAQSLDHVGPMARSAADCALLLEAMAGPDADDPGSAGRGFQTDLAGGVSGLRVGVIRHFHERDNPGSPAALANLEAALGVLRSLGAEVADATISPMADWHAVAVTITLAEAHAIHGGWLRARFGEYGAIFRERVVLGALIGSETYLDAQRRRRALCAEMDGVFRNHDVLITLAQPGEAPAIDAVSRWGVLELGSFAAPFNLTGGPSVAVGTGFGAGGLPTGMQIAGAPFADALVLRVAHAYQQATDWHTRRPGGY
jgi:aspartyl-tRNA(Asn)/glutamyl-tRNA(Gln) amidotransferase subunit A